MSAMSAVETDSCRDKDRDMYGGFVGPHRRHRRSFGSLVICTCPSQSQEQTSVFHKEPSSQHRSMHISKRDRSGSLPIQGRQNVQAIANSPNMTESPPMDALSSGRRGWKMHTLNRSRFCGHWLQRVLGGKRRTQNSGISVHPTVIYGENISNAQTSREFLEEMHDLVYCKEGLPETLGTAYVKGAAARAAAAAQNQLVQRLREAQLSDLGLVKETESGIGIDCADDAPYKGASVRRKDPARQLPVELFAHIFGFVSASDISNAELVSKAWRNCASSDQLWRSIFRSDFKDDYDGRKGQKHFGLGPQNTLPNTDWRGMWKARMVLQDRWRDGHAAAIYLEGHTDCVYCVQFDTSKIITGSRDRTVRIWDAETYKCKQILGTPSRTSHTAQPLPAEASLCGSRPFAKVYPPFRNPPDTPDLLFHHTGSVLCLQYDEKVLITGSSDNSLIVWEEGFDHQYTPIRRLQNHTAGVLDVSFDKDHIVSCSKDASICIWHRESGALLRRIHGHRGPVNAVQLRGNLAVSASGDGIAKLWNLESGLCIKEFSGKNRGMACVEISPDCRTILAGGNDQVIYQFDAVTGELVRELKGHNDLVRSLHLDSVSGRVVSGSYDNSVKAFDLATGRVIASFAKWTSSWILSAKADYRRIIATSQDSRVLIIDFGYNLPGMDLLEGR